MVVGTFLFAGLATAFELIPPWLIKVIIDDVIQAGQTELLVWVFLALCAAYVLRNLCGSIIAGARKIPGRADHARLAAPIHYSA